MVAGARGDARVRKAPLRCDAGDDRLRPIPPGHRQRIGAIVQGPADELFEVGAGRQLDRLDSSRARLGRQLEPRDLPAARAGVVEEHRMRRTRRRRQSHGGVERVARGDDDQRERCGHPERERGVPREQQRDEAHGQQRADPEAQDPQRAAAHEPLPRGGDCEREQRGTEHTTREVDDREDDEERQRGDSERERRDGREAAADHVAI